MSGRIVMGASRRHRVSMNVPTPAEASVACGPAAFFVVDAIALPGVDTAGRREIHERSAPPTDVP